MHLGREKEDEERKERSKSICMHERRVSGENGKSASLFIYPRTSELASEGCFRSQIMPGDR